jgi:hypothetical protein
LLEKIGITLGFADDLVERFRGEGDSVGLRGSLESRGCGFHGKCSDWRKGKETLRVGFGATGEAENQG